VFLSLSDHVLFSFARCDGPVFYMGITFLPPLHGLFPLFAEFGAMVVHAY